ncbi:MAG: inositol monophosphatase [Alphaproteobacteria bacterium]|nr:inositol monophosphatase [Alphaproteobacteria bacterium]
MIVRRVSDQLSQACAIAEEAGVLMKRLFHERPAGRFELKGEQDYLTEADAQVEELVAARLGRAFPGDSFLGEEGGGSIGQRTWVVDPIDGTANFARGIPHFCVSIALVEGGEIALGAIVQPLTGETYAAERGRGATLNHRAINVSPIADLRQSTIELGWSTRRPLSDYVAMLGRVVATGAGTMRMGSGALGLAYVAAGRTDGYAELHINSWDSLAGILLVREAGGWTNDFLADDGLSEGNPILACTPALQDALQAATRLKF